MVFVVVISWFNSEGELTSYSRQSYGSKENAKKYVSYLQTKYDTTIFEDSDVLPLKGYDPKLNKTCLINIEQY